MSARQRVAVVTGGGGGIGAAIAEELGRRGWFVVTLDPLVTLEGTEQLPAPTETTAGRIVAAGGSARASAASVTNGEAVRALFGELVDEHGGLDAVVNVAGITRQTGFAHGTEEDWLAVLGVHLGGYLNVLGAALPLMAAAGHGRILGVTSGSGWRAADAGAYSAAKRVVASLTWQLGSHTPPGVTVNALSPMAATRMVAAALERAQRERGTSTGGGGVSLASMPGPEGLGPLGAHLVGDQFGWCNGQVIFSCGPEVSLVGQPRLMEVVRSEGVTALAPLIEAVVPRAFAKAESRQVSGGGSNPRFGAIFGDGAPSELASGDVRNCVVVSDRPEVAGPLLAALEGRSIAAHRVESAGNFEGAAAALSAAADVLGPIDAVAVALAGDGPQGSVEGWERVLAEHAGILSQLHTDASWARAAADYAAMAQRPVRLVSVIDAATAGGRSRAQACAQLARVGGLTTDGRVAAFAVALEASGDAAGTAAGELAAHLLAHPDGPALAGAEHVVGAGWFGLRSHPRPLSTFVFGGPELPGWFDATMREALDR